MSRCPDCNKFCSREVQQPEVNGCEVRLSDPADSSAGEYADALAWERGKPSFAEVHLEIEVDANSACCGSTVASARSDVDFTIQDEDALENIKQHLLAAKASSDDPDRDGTEDCLFEIEIQDHVHDPKDDKTPESITLTWALSCSCGRGKAEIAEGEEVVSGIDWEDAY